MSKKFKPGSSPARIAWYMNWRLIRINRPVTLAVRRDAFLFGTGFYSLNDSGIARRIDPMSVRYV